MVILVKRMNTLNNETVISEKLSHIISLIKASSPPLVNKSYDLHQFIR